MEELKIIMVTYPASGDYASLCRKLVEEGIAASVNIVRADSVYYWEGKVMNAEEVLLMIKTEGSLAGKVKEVVRSEHPYKVPSIIELSPDDVYKPYLEWIVSSTVGRRR